jgi:lipoprotein NlpD
VRGAGLRPVLGLALAASLLVACGGNPPAPIEDRAARGRADADGIYTVQRGDTLYSIAWRYGLEYSALAAGNGISPPYTIYPGQKLDLRAKAPPRASSGEAAAAPARRSAPAAAPAARPATTTSSRAGSADGGPVSAWRWPASGRVIRKFSPTLHKGIDIAGDRGDPVRAVAAGRVVYAGAGIAGYGELLIVRHNAHYLSAYGHNERLLAREGQAVSAGETIATRGSSGTDSVKLHFEIRRDGKPVDPLTLLPRR